MFIKSEYAYPSWSKWMRVMSLTPEQVKAFLPEFDGRNMVNKGVTVLKTDDVSYYEWNYLQKKERSIMCSPPLVSGIVAIECHDGSYYLIKAL